MMWSYRGERESSKWMLWQLCVKTGCACLGYHAYHTVQQILVCLSFSPVNVSPLRAATVTPSSLCYKAQQNPLPKSSKM